MLTIIFISNKNYGQKSCLKSLSKNEIEAANDCVKSKITKHPNNVYLNFVLAEIKSNRDFDHYEIYNAYQCIIKCRDSYISVNDDDKEKFNKDFIKFHYDTNFIDQTVHNICTKALIDVQSKNTLTAYNTYIGVIEISEFNNQAIQLRNTHAFSIAQTDNTLEAFLNFISTYPEALEIPKAIELRKYGARPRCSPSLGAYSEL